MAEKSAIASISQAEERPFKTPQLPALRAVVSEPAPQKRRFLLLLYFQRVGSPSIWGWKRAPAAVADFRTRARQGLQTCFGGARMPARPHSPDTTAHRAKRGDFSAFRETAVLFVNGVVIPVFSKSAFLLSVLRHPGRLKWVRASARNCGWRIAGRDACPTRGWVKPSLQPFAADGPS